MAVPWENSGILHDGVANLGSVPGVLDVPVVVGGDVVDDDVAVVVVSDHRSPLHLGNLGESPSELRCAHGGNPERKWDRH